MTTNDWHHQQSVSFESQRSEIYRELERDLQTHPCLRSFKHKTLFISLPCLRWELFYDSDSFNPWTHTQSHHDPIVVSELGVWWSALSSFRYVRAFRKDFTFSEKPLIFLVRWCLQDFMDGGPAGSLWRHQHIRHVWIVPRVRYQAN